MAVVEPPPAAFVMLENGPGCGDASITTAGECGEAAASLGYEASVTSGSWGHAPLGCFVGHPIDGWTHTYFNSQAGQTGRDVYRSLCLGEAYVELENGPGCDEASITTAEECGEAAGRLGYSVLVTSVSDINAPLGCFTGHPVDHWSHTFFNTQDGATGNANYRSICKNDINECASNNGGCASTASCTNTMGGRSCACNSGYSGNGVTCADINECASNNGGCSSNAVCSNTMGGHTCACISSDYTGNGYSCTARPAVWLGVYALGVGSLGPQEQCPNNGFANMLYTQLEGRQGSRGDDTALNSIRMYCSNGGYVNSLMGIWGDWSNRGSCSTGFNAYRLRVEERQGSQGDDTATNGVQLFCVNGAQVNESGYVGDWSGIQYCPGTSRICGMMTRVEDNLGTQGDDTAMNDVWMKCCYGT